MNEETLFHLALERPGPERAAFLEQACAGDAALRQRLAVLLLAHDHPGSFLEQPPLNPAGTLDGQAGRPENGSRLSPEGPGSRIGPFKLLQQIGEGGMGAVFMAEQLQPVQRKVALKILKPGLDSRRVIARFEAERQALALMDHPNIAKVLDAGTTSTGRPYFVMELVKGVPITKYCDERRLTPKQRLELFLPVCQAVQHAHQKGIIHRDLKPSNVLVAPYDGRPVPKVIDFGVAKATGPKLTEKTLFTEFGAIIGTLEYMSPEQAELNQLDIDTRSDVYALGVLLYELLTGTTPLEKQRVKESSLFETLRQIREEEPPRPSTRLDTTLDLPLIAANRGLEAKKLSGIVRGEIDWIVMRALEKDRNRRYQTANGLARDIQCYLNDEPVEACPPSLGYTLRKLARRHRASLGTAVVLAAALIVGTALVWQQRQEAVRQRDTAREQRQQAEASLRQARQAVDDSFTLLSESTLLNHPTLEPLRKQLLQSAVRYYEEFVRDHGDDPELQAELVAACFRITNMIYALGVEEDWLTPFEKGVTVMEALMRQQPDLTALKPLQAGIFRPMATYWPTPNPEATGRAFERACAVWQQLVRAYPDVPGFKSDLALFRGIIGMVQLRQSEYAASARSFGQACDLIRQARAARPDVPHYRVLLGMGLTFLQDALAETGAAREAEEADREALELMRQLAADFPDQPYYQELLPWTWDLLASGRQRRGQLREEEEAIRQELAAMDKLARAFPTVSRYRNGTLFPRLALAELLWGSDRRAEAAELYREVRGWTDRLSPEDANGHDLRAWFLANCPEPQFRDPSRAVELAKRATTLAPQEQGYWTTLGAAHYRAGNGPEAVEALTRVPPNAQTFPWSCFFLAMAHARLGHSDQARRCYDQGVHLMETNHAGDRELKRFRAEAAEFLGRQGPTN